MVRLVVAALISMPDAPLVKVLPALIVTKSIGLAIRIPAQLASAPNKVVLGPVTIVLFHTPTSAAPGATPPTQELPRLRLSALSALIRSAPMEANGVAARNVNAASQQ